jgi:hypothetical protein
MEPTMNHLIRILPRASASVGLSTSTSLAWRRPGDRAYISFGGALHESDTRTIRRLRDASTEAAETSLYREDDER